MLKTKNANLIQDPLGNHTQQMYVKVTSHSDVPQAIKDFRFLCERSGIFDDLKDRRFYKKPSEGKKRKKYIKKLLSGDKSLSRQRERMQRAQEEKLKKKRNAHSRSR